MRTQNNVNLYKYNTMRLHSTASTLYIPTSHDELVVLVKELNAENSKFYLLSAGSNIILNEKIAIPIIYLMEVDNTLIMHDGNIVECGCSVRIQTLIRFIQEQGLGGIEYLFSVPCSVGGAIYMNAGRGKKHNKSISNFISKIVYFDGESIKEIEKGIEDMFSYRHSPFQDDGSIILKAYFVFPEQNSDETEYKIKERLMFSNKRLDTSKPSCGSVFCKGNSILFRLLKGFKYRGAQFSSKTPNWISNVNNASYSDIMSLIKKAVFLHKLFFQKIKLELKIFN
jgi:UDP-N-acetylmuramate dehydrogenase